MTSDYFGHQWTLQNETGYLIVFYEFNKGYKGGGGGGGL